jgi:hypothetical protein
MTSARLLAVLVAALISISSVSRAEPVCRVENDVVQLYHHMLSRVIVPWLVDEAPIKYNWWNDWVPATAAEACNFMDVRPRDFDLVAGAPGGFQDRLQEGRALEERR